MQCRFKETEKQQFIYKELEIRKASEWYNTVKQFI